MSALFPTTPHPPPQHPTPPPGDALGENYALSDGDGGDSDSEGADSQGEDGGGTAANALEARRQAAAAGGHPLQQAFREAAARLAAKHGVEVPVTQRGEGDSDSEDEGETDSEDAEGAEEEGGSSDDAAEEGGEEAAVGGSWKRAKAAAAAEREGEEEEEQGIAGSSGSEEGESGDEGSDSEQQKGEEQEEEAAPHPTKALKRQQQAAAGSKPAAAAAAAAELEGPLDLSFTPAVPESYQEFAALVGGRPAEQLGLAIQRIRTFNAAALATDSKRKLQVSAVGTRDAAAITQVVCCLAVCRCACELVGRGICGEEMCVGGGGGGSQWQQQWDQV